MIKFIISHENMLRVVVKNACFLEEKVSVFLGSCSFFH